MELDTFRNRKIISTTHGIERLGDPNRFDQASKDAFTRQLLVVIKDAMDLILDEYNDTPGTYVVHSKSTGIGVVLIWKRDTMTRRDKRYHALIKTVLPIRPAHFKSKNTDVMIMTEILDQVNYYLQLTEKKFRSLKENTHRFVRVKELGIELCLFENMLWDITNATQLLVK
jgi:hypothetical protein